MRHLHLALLGVFLIAIGIASSPPSPTGEPEKPHIMSDITDNPHFKPGDWPNRMLTLTVDLATDDTAPVAPAAADRMLGMVITIPPGGDGDYLILHNSILMGGQGDGTVAGEVDIRINNTPVAFGQFQGTFDTNNTVASMPCVSLHHHVTGLVAGDVIEVFWRTASIASPPYDSIGCVVGFGFGDRHLTAMRVRS